MSTRLDWARILPLMLDGLQSALSSPFPSLDFARLRADFLDLRSEGRKRAAHELRETPALESLRSALALQGQNLVDLEILQAGVDAFFAPEESEYPVIPGVPEMLAELKAMRLGLAILSNATCGQLIRRALQHRGLMAFFDQVVVSADLGVCKPDPAVFAHTLELLKVTPAQAVMVGDRLDTDIAGAQRIGMRSVLADFLGDRAPTPAGGPRPDAIAREAREVVTLLESWLR